MSKGYSCKRDDWGWLVIDQADGSKRIDGVWFSDGHKILFRDMAPKQMDAYLKAGRLKRSSDGTLSVIKGQN